MHPVLAKCRCGTCQSTIYFEWKCHVTKTRGIYVEQQYSIHVECVGGGDHNDFRPINVHAASHIYCIVSARSDGLQTLTPFLSRTSSASSGSFRSAYYARPGLRRCTQVQDTLRLEINQLNSRLSKNVLRTSKVVEKWVVVWKRHPNYTLPFSYLAYYEQRRVFDPVLTPPGGQTDPFQSQPNPWINDTVDFWQHDKMYEYPSEQTSNLQFQHWRHPNSPSEALGGQFRRVARRLFGPWNSPEVLGQRVFRGELALLVGGSEAAQVQLPHGSRHGNRDLQRVYWYSCGHFTS